MNASELTGPCRSALAPNRDAVDVARPFGGRDRACACGSWDPRSDTLRGRRMSPGTAATLVLLLLTGWSGCCSDDEKPSDAGSPLVSNQPCKDAAEHEQKVKDLTTRGVGVLPEVVALLSRVAKRAPGENRREELSDGEFVQESVSICALETWQEAGEDVYGHGARQALRDLAVGSRYPSIRAAAVRLLAENPSKEDIKVIIEALADSHVEKGHAPPAAAASDGLSCLTQIKCTSVDDHDESDEAWRKRRDFWSAWWTENQSYAFRELLGERRGVRIRINERAKELRRAVDFQTGEPLR